MPFLIIFLLGTNFAYNLWRIFFKYSLSFGSSLSNNSRNSYINFYVINALKFFMSIASFIINWRKSSYTGYKWGHDGSTIISSSSIPVSPANPYFFTIGNGLKIFFLIIYITCSKFGITKFYIYWAFDIVS